MIVAVLTCPRPGGVSYLDETLAAIDADGLDARKLIVVDRGPPAARPGWNTVLSPRRYR